MAWGVRAAVALIALAAVIAWIALLFGVSVRVFAPNSDGANALLAARSIAHGNIFLHGWRLGADSFWSLDLAFLSGLIAVFGLGPSLAHWGPLAIAVVLVAVAGWTATIGLNAGRAVAGGVAFILIGLPVPVFAFVLLQGSLHISTTLACLAALALLATGEGRTKLALAGVLVAAAVLGDPYAFAIGVAPLLAAAVVARARGEPLAVLAHRSAAVLAGVAAALIARVLITHLGGFSLLPAPDRVPASQWLPNLGHAFHWWGADLGLTGDSGLPDPRGLVQLVHGAGAVLVVGGLLAGVWRVAGSLLARARRGRVPGVQGHRQLASPSASWIDDGLLFGTLGAVAGYTLLSVPPGSKEGTRYLVPGVIYGSILGARLAGRLAGQVAGRVGYAVPAGLAGLGVLYLWGAVATVVQDRVAPVPTSAVGTWLAAHGFSDGLGSYWEASATTLQTNGRTGIRPVVGSSVDGHLHWLSTNAFDGWFRPGSSVSRVLVYPAPCGAGGVGLVTATATFGRPERVVAVGSYQIAIWAKDLVPSVGSPVLDWHDAASGCPP